MKKTFAIIVVMFLMYACCKFPDEVVFVCEWGFVLLKELGMAIYNAIKGSVTSGIVQSAV